MQYSMVNHCRKYFLHAKELLTKAHFGTGHFERLSSSQKLKMNYCYGQRVQSNVILLEGCAFLRGPFIGDLTLQPLPCISEPVNSLLSG